jgi:osmotically-inducible protein OsmY
METQRDSLLKAAGAFIGVLIGGSLGPVIFNAARLVVPAGSFVGTLIGGLIGYAVTLGLIRSCRRQSDRDLELAANSVLRDAGLPASVKAEVSDSRVTLLGEADQYSQRQLAERALSAVPDVASVTDHIHLRISGRGLKPEEIKRRIGDAFLQHAELDTHRIQVRVDHSGIVLEGTVPSSAELIQVEELAWNIAGNEQVENRLKIAA